MNMIPGFFFAIFHSLNSLYITQMLKPSGDILVHIKKLVNATDFILDFIKMLSCVKC